MDISLSRIHELVEADDLKSPGCAEFFGITPSHLREFKQIRYFKVTENTHTFVRFCCLPYFLSALKSMILNIVEFYCLVTRRSLVSTLLLYKCEKVILAQKCQWYLLIKVYLSHAHTHTHPTIETFKSVFSYDRKVDSFSDKCLQKLLTIHLQPIRKVSISMTSWKFGLLLKAIFSS